MLTPDNTDGWKRQNLESTTSVETWTERQSRRQAQKTAHQWSLRGIRGKACPGKASPYTRSGRGGHVRRSPNGHQKSDASD